MVYKISGLYLISIELKIYIELLLLPIYLLVFHSNRNKFHTKNTFIIDKTFNYI